MNPQQVMIIGIVFGFLMGFMGREVGRMLKRRTKIELLLLDGDLHTATTVWAKKSAGDGLAPRPGRGMCRYILRNASRFNHTGDGHRRDMYVMDDRHGWGYTVPSDADHQTKPEMLTLMLDDPETYRRAVDQNEQRDALRAGEDDESWVVKVAPFALLALLLILLGVGYVVYAIVKAKGGA